jgi:hypothetical protein
MASWHSLCDEGLNRDVSQQRQQPTHHRLRIRYVTLRADDIPHSDDRDLDRLWERLTRPIPDGAIAGDTADWDSIIFEIAEALDPGSARAPGRHARRCA